MSQVQEKCSQHFRPPASERTKFLNEHGLNPSFVRGKRIRVPVFRKQWYTIKDTLRQGWLDGQFQDFVEGKPADEATPAFVEKLHADIDNLHVSKSLKQEAHTYLDGKAETPLYRSGENGAALFSSQSTTLTADIVRAENGGLFQQIPELSDIVRTRIYQEQGVHYRGEALLGKGPYAQVSIYERLDTQDGDRTLIAAKVSGFDSTGPDKEVAAQQAARNVDKLKREFDIVSALPDSDNLPKAYGFAKVNGQGYFFTSLHIQGDMQKVLEAVPDELTQQERRTVVRTLSWQLLQTVRNLHNQRIYHQDIKLDNLLLSDKGSVVLFDFGEASHIPDGVDDGPYMPPEAKNRGTRHFAIEDCENWDQLLVGKTLREFINSLSDGGLLDIMEPRLQRIIEGLTHIEADRRSSLDDVLRDSYFHEQILQPQQLLKTIGRQVVT